MKTSNEILARPTTLTLLRSAQVKIDELKKLLEDIQRSDPDLTRLETENFRSVDGSLYTASRSLGRVVTHTHSLYEMTHKVDIFPLHPRERLV